MRKIFKQFLDPSFLGRDQDVLMYSGNAFAFSFQANKPLIWYNALVDFPFINRTFRLCFTGDETPSSHYEYIGTSTNQLGLVYHLFEKTGTNYYTNKP